MTDKPKFTPGPWGNRERVDLARPIFPDKGPTIAILMTAYRDALDLEYAEARANYELVMAAPEMFEALDPDTLDAIADEIDCFKHSARAASLRGIAKRQRATLLKAGGSNV